jgi:hypothetical protein
MSNPRCCQPRNHVPGQGLTADVDAGSAGGIGFDLADDLADDGGGVAASEDEIPQQVHDRAAFGPHEVAAASKFTEGSWLILVALPVLVSGFERVHRTYQRIGASLHIARTPAPPRPGRSVVVVPVGGVSDLTRLSLDTALSLGDDVVAVHVGHDDEPTVTRGVREQWEAWHPEVPLTILTSYDRDLGRPFADFVQGYGDQHAFVLIAEVEPTRWWERMLRNNRGAVLERAVWRRTAAVVCRMRFPVGPART